MQRTLYLIIIFFGLANLLISQEQVTNHKGEGVFGQEIIHEYNDKLYRVFFKEGIMVIDISDSSNIKLLYDIDLPQVDNSLGKNGTESIYLFNNFIIYNPAEYRENNYPLYFIDLLSGQIFLHNIVGRYNGVYFEGHKKDKVFLTAASMDEQKSEILIFDSTTSSITNTYMYNSNLVYYSDSSLFCSLQTDSSLDTLIGYNLKTGAKDTISENARFIRITKTDNKGGALFMDSLGRVFISNGTKSDSEELNLRGVSDFNAYSSINYDNKIRVFRSTGDSLEVYSKTEFEESSFFLKYNGLPKSILETSDKYVLINNGNIVSCVDKNTKKNIEFEVPKTWIPGSGAGYDFNAIYDKQIIQDSFIMFYHSSDSKIIEIYWLNIYTMQIKKINWSDQKFIYYQTTFIIRDGYYYISGYNQELGMELYIGDLSGNKMRLTGDIVPFHNGTKSIGDPKLYFDKIIYPSVEVKNVFSINEDKKLVPIFLGIESTFGPALVGDYYYIVHKTNINKRSISRLNPDLSTSFIYESDKEIFGIHLFQGKLFLQEGISSRYSSITKTIDLETKEVNSFELLDYQFLFSTGDEIFLQNSKRELYKYTPKSKVLLPLGITLGYWGDDFFKTSKGIYIHLKKPNKLYRILDDTVHFIAENVYSLKEISVGKIMIEIFGSQSFIYNEINAEKLMLPSGGFTFGEVAGEIIFVTYQTKTENDIYILESKSMRYDSSNHKFIILNESSTEELGRTNHYSIINGKIFKIALLVDNGIGEILIYQVKNDFSTKKLLLNTNISTIQGGILYVFSKIESPDTKTFFLSVNGSVFLYNNLMDSIFKFTLGTNFSYQIDQYEFSIGSTHYFTSYDKYKSYQLYSIKLPEISSVPKVTSLDNVVIYPVPATNRLHFQGLDSGSYTITSYDGRLSYSGIIFDGNIDISGLPNGLFIISFKENIIPKIFIKQ